MQQQSQPCCVTFAINAEQDIWANLLLEIHTLESKIRFVRVPRCGICTLNVFVFVNTFEKGIHIPIQIKTHLKKQTNKHLSSALDAKMSVKIQ